MTNFYSEKKTAVSIAALQSKTSSEMKYVMWFVLTILAINSSFAQAPTVDTPTITAVGTTTATLGGNVTGTLTHRGTRWRTSSPVGTNNEFEEASTTAGTFTQARTGLPAASKIFFVAYARNNAAAATTSETVFFTEPVQLTGGQFTATATSSSAINLTFPSADTWEGTNATGGYVIFRKSGSAPTVAGLTDGAAPPTDGTGDKIATITDGTFTSFNNNSGLSAETNYFYTIVPFVWDGADPLTYNYNLSSPQSANDYTFSSEPSGHATGSLTATAASGTQINLTFNSVTTSSITNADGYIVLIKSTAIVAGDLASLADGAAPNSFGLYKDIVNSTSGGSYNASGLSPNTTYHFAIIPFNRGSDDQTYNYLTTTGFPTGSATTLVTATFTPLATDDTPVISSTILSAGATLKVLAGFSATSDDTQTISAMNFNYSATPIQFTTEYIYRSTSATSIGLVIQTDNSPDGNFDNWASVPAGDKTINSTPVYYFLVVDVSNAVTSSTPSITVNPTAASITLSSGNKNAFSINRTFTFGTSQLSDIILTGGTSNPINYRNFVQTSIANDQSNSISLADYQIRDGGGNDPDNKGMSVTSIELQITNSQNIRRIALFDDNGNTELAGTETADLATSGTTTIVFTPSTPISVTDNGTYDLNVRAIFKSAVTDKQSIQVSITNVTASSSNLSGFKPVNTWASTQTAIGTNVIAVVATKLAFVANPPNTVKSTNFSLTVRALDSSPHNNLDLDYTGKVDLIASGGPGTLVGGAQSLSPNLVAGTFTWNTLQINQAGTYALEANDDAYTDPPESQTDLFEIPGQVIITSSNSSITQPSALNLCFGGNSQTLGNIVITETDPSGFSSGGTFSISLPNGFVFDQSVTTGLSVSGGSDISGASSYSYPSANVVEFSFTISGTANTNTITISGLKISSPHPGGDSPSGIGGNITRSGGTAALAGVTPGTVLGTVNAALGSPAPVGLGFTVQKINANDVEVAPGETRFSQNSNPVRLVGSPSGGTTTNEFIGSGVTFVSGEYRFNPQALSPGTYPITLKQKTGTGTNCEFQVVKTFEVYTTNITNLSAQYCTNSPETLPMNVTSYINSFYNDGVYYSGWSLVKFIFWDTPTFTQQDITTPANNIFDPKLAAYQPIYSSTGNTYGVIGIWIGFIIQGNYDPDGAGILYLPAPTTRTIWQLIAVRPAPAVSFTIPKTSFCADETPVTLTGTPANSNSTGDDFFSTTTVGQGASISSTPAPVVWSFNPQAVSNVALNTPQTVSITYTYRDPSTGCSGTSAPINVTVNARPGTVLSNAITGGVNKAICQGETLTSFEATPAAGVSYKWYSDLSLLNQVGTSNSFTPPSPPFDNKVAGTTNFWVTQTIAGCESNKQPASPTTALQLAVTVNATPGKPVANDISIDYCVGETIDANDFKILSGTNIRWYADGDPIKGVLLLDNVNSPTLSQITTAQPGGLGVSTSIATTYKFAVTQTSSGCEGILFPTIVTVIIKPLPVVTIVSSDDADQNRICTTDGLIKFDAIEGNSIAANGVWSGTGLSAALTPNPIIGSVDLNPLVLAPGSYTLQYAYTNPATQCSNNFSKNFLIHPKVTLDVSASNACLGSPVVITNNSSITSGGTIDFAAWDFDDRSTLSQGNYNDPVTANEGRTLGTYKAPTHRYSNTGNYQITGVLTTNAGCKYEVPALGVLVSPLPKINFGWKNACRDEITGLTNTQFVAIETSNPQLAISQYNWNFAVTSTLTFTGGGGGNNPTVNYNKEGQDSVRLIVSTAAGCRDTLTKVLYVVPTYPKITETNSYKQDFEADTDGWIAGGLNPSWKYEVLAAKGKDDPLTRGKGWDTDDGGGNNYHNKGEQSWVLTGCFNFSEAQKPVITLDLFSETPFGVNGAVLQYNLDGNILNDASWITLGDVDEGINWYDASGISNSPGNQSANDVGWSGDIRTLPTKYKTWANGAYKLDKLIGANNVTFRIAFAAGNAQSDGFAFDNLFVGERSRIVLLENFTNTTLNANTHNNKYNDIGTDAELVKLQFHTPFPGIDQINKMNSPMHDARTAFYGITESPTMRIDGNFQSGSAINWIEDVYDDRVLIPADFKITILHSLKDGKVEIISVLKPVSDEPLANLVGAHVFTVVAEKTVGSFEYVAREMLPNSSGIKITADLIKSDPLKGDSIALPKVVWEKQSGDAIVVFVQRIEGNNKNVLQANALRNPIKPVLTTAIERILPEYVSMFPNPAKREFKVELPAVTQTDVELTLIDQVGRVHKAGKITSGNNSATVNVEHLAEGIYILQIGNDSSGLIRKKMMIVQGN